MPAWYAGAYAPDRVLGAASLCTPYFTPGETDLIEAYDELRGPKHYMATFQEPGTYVLRAVASDGSLFTYDNVTVTVTH